MIGWCGGTAASVARMPSKASRFAVYDSSVYVENFRTGRFTLQMLQTTWIPRCSAVVLHELLRGARTAMEERFVRDLLRRSRVITPTITNWIEAAEVLAAIRKREHYDVRRVRDLAFDLLIALTARSIGAAVVTCDEADFHVLSRYVMFDVVYWR